MKLLLDTHFIIWLSTKQSAISPIEWEILNRPSHQIVASAVSIWEIRIKYNATYVSGERKGKTDPMLAAAYLDSLEIPIIPLDAQTAATPLLVPIAHKDPFDELLLVQAQQSGARLLTRDRSLLGHPLAYQPQ